MRLSHLAPLVMSVLLLPCASASAEQDARPSIFFEGLLDMAYPFESGGLPEVNQFRRGDSLFDNMRLTLFADVVFSRRLSLLNQLILDPSSRASIGTFYRPVLRYTAWEAEGADLYIEAGKLPTSFGSYSPRAYSNRGALVGPPLVYHYFTTARANRLLSGANDILDYRRDRAVSEDDYAIGSTADSGHGLALIYDPCWDTGVRAIGSYWRFEYFLAVTQGTLSDPRSSGGDSNDGKQVSGRLGVVLSPGFILGASLARGPYLRDSLRDTLRSVGAGVEDFHQRAIGFDAEFGYRHFALVGELILNRWEAPGIHGNRLETWDLDATGWYVEGKYTISPGLYGAARYGRIDFSKVDDGAGNRLCWDDPIQRWEYGVGYHFRDGVIGKLIRQDVRVTHDFHTRGTASEHFHAIQLSISF
jgi:hypothetical protein